MTRFSQDATASDALKGTQVRTRLDCFQRRYGFVHQMRQIVLHVIRASDGMLQARVHRILQFRSVANKLGVNMCSFAHRCLYNGASGEACAMRRLLGACEMRLGALAVSVEKTKARVQQVTSIRVLFREDDLTCKHMRRGFTDAPSAITDTTSQGLACHHLRLP